jgi:hypothetical protein
MGMKSKTAYMASLLLVAALAAPASADTFRFDITEAGLGIFGVQFTTDYATFVEEVRDMRITETRVHLEFNTEHQFGNLPEAANIAVQFQAPIMDIARILTVSGADLGWSGTGTFTGDVATNFLNDDFLDFSEIPDGSFILWFFRIVNLDDRAPLLGGAFVDSFIEVDVVPEPAAAALLLMGAATIVTRRRAEPR